MIENSPIAMILEATKKISEALQLLQAALQATEARKIDGKPFEIDFAFLDAPLEDVEWGYDHKRRLLNMFEDWNKFETRSDNPDVPRLLVTVRDLLTISEDELLATPRVGEQAIGRIRAVLAKHGLVLKV
jgi:hypothetical protein